MAFAKFMNKKDFHPGSKANIKRAWMAEQKTLASEMKQKELQLQKEKEQQRFHNRQLVSKDERIKSGLDFLYDAPPGYKKEQEKSESDSKGEEVRFEWQKGAPREAYAKNLGLEAKDQPFGIPVRNVKCIKCGKWGHVNTDRECPMFNQQSTSDVDALDIADPMRLLKDMQSDGLTLKQNVLGRVYNPKDPNQQILASDDEEEEDPEAAFLASLTDKQKRKLLRKLDKMEQRESESSKHKKKKKKKRRSTSSEAESSEEEEDGSPARKHRKRSQSDRDRAEKSTCSRTDERDGGRRHRRTSSGRDLGDNEQEKRHRKKTGSDVEGDNPKQHRRTPRGDDRRRDRHHDDRSAERNRHTDRHRSREKSDRERRR